MGYNISGSIKSPCLNCQNRRAGCHIKGNCVEYDIFKEKCEEIKAAKQKHLNERTAEYETRYHGKRNKKEWQGRNV